MLVKKSIWFISKYASPPHSRGGQRGISLAQAFVRQGHHATVIASSSNHFATFESSDWTRAGVGFRTAEFSGVKMLIHVSLPYQRTSSLPRILSWVHFEWGLLRLPTGRLQPPTHIIISSLSLLSVINAYRLSRKFNAKLIFEVRDIWPLTAELELDLSQKNYAMRVLGWIERFGYTRADVVVGTMPNLVEHVVGEVGEVTRVETVPLGIDDDLAELTQRYEPPAKSDGTMVVGYAGSIGRTNSVEILLFAAKQLGPEQGIRFEIWGSGERLKDLRKDFSDQPHIRFRGHIERRGLFSELSRAHLLCLATDDSALWKYGQSLNKLVEYMLVGRPIIAAYSGFPSMINEAKCGTFVPLGDPSSLIKAILHYRDMSVPERKKIDRKSVV